jgi:hypothetical protein
MAPTTPREGTCNRTQDLVDIEELFRANLGDLDLERIRRYYALFDRQDELDELLQKITND